MFKVAFLIGIYSYIIFSLGVLGLLNKSNILFSSILFISLSYVYFFKIRKVKLKFNLKIKEDLTFKVLLFLILCQVAVNVVGVLGPEISFDALWYHLTLPKLFLLNNSIFHIHGSLLYYSDMPKLTEMLYIAVLPFFNETGAKFIHFCFGLLTLFAIYGVSRKFLSRKYSLLACLIFYSSLVVGWESISAYIDLSRSFFEVMALLGFMNWVEKKKRNWLIISAVMMGFAITVKLVAAFSILIFVALIAYVLLNKKRNVILFMKNSLFFSFFSVLVPLPWFIFSYLNTNNPFYPYFSISNIDSGGLISFPNLLSFFKDMYTLFLNLNDPISPIYLILLPIILIRFKYFKKEIKIISIYTFLGILIWYISQEQRGGRFVLPYLTAFSVLCAFVVFEIKNKDFKKYLIILVMIVSVLSIGYRGVANTKFLPVILGKETKSQFLSKNLNFSYGDFYDIDNYFEKNIKNSDKVLLYSFHNLYYINFPFTDSSWVNKGDEFNYIAIQNSKIPSRFSDWKEIYYNDLTKVRVYSKEGKTWAY